MPIKRFYQMSIIVNNYLSRPCINLKLLNLIRGYTIRHTLIKQMTAQYIILPYIYRTDCQTKIQLNYTH